MREKELIELLSSIIEANRTFYVGAASPVDNNGQVSLNGISARAIGASETNDVIVKDSQTGIWYAFVRGYGQQIVSSRNISLFQQHPRDKKAGGFFIFIAAESLQDKLLFTQIKQLSGTYQLGDYPAYFADIAPWIIAAPVAYVTDDNYLAFPNPSSIHSVTGNAVFEPAGGKLNLKESFFSLSGMGKIAAGKIKKDSEVKQVFLEFVFTPSIAASGIRRDIERWSLGLSKDGLAAAGGAFNSSILKRSLTIGFKNERNKEYGTFYAWYKHTYSLTGQIQDPSKLPQDPVASCSVAQLEMITEQPALINTISPFIRRITLASVDFTIPPTSVTLPEDDITVEFHWGNGSFNPDTNLVLRLFSKNDAGRFRKSIKYAIKKSETPIARKAKLYIDVAGSRKYARYVRYEDTDQYRIGFFEGASQPSDTDLFFYISSSAAIPQKADETSALAFLLSQYLVFPASGEEVFAGDDFLWGNNFKARGSASFSQNGFIDPSFSEKGDTGGCTFFKESEDEKYQTSQSIQLDMLPSEEWVYSEELEFYDDTEALLDTIQNPLPRLTKESSIRVRIKGTRRFGSPYLCGNRGRCLESFQYQVDQTLISITQDYLAGGWIFWSNYLTGGGDFWPTATSTRYYFPEKHTIAVTHEYTRNVFRVAKLYIELGGQRYYAGRARWPRALISFLVFRQNYTSFADGEDFYVELGTDTPRVKKQIPGAGTRADVNDPFDDAYYTFPVGGEKRFSSDDFLWASGSTRSATPGFDASGFINSTFPVADSTGNYTLFKESLSNGDSFVADTAVTIGIEFYPEESWGKAERIIFDGGTEVTEESLYTIEPLLGDDSFSRFRAYELRTSAGNGPFLEDLDEVLTLDSYNEIFYPCNGTAIASNKDPLVSDRNAVFGFEHLLPSESFAIDMASTLLSFSGTSVEVFGDGRILFGELELIPFLAALDTTDFDDGKLTIAGYISYQEGYIEESTFGEDKIRALRIRWMRAYPFDPGKSNYYDEYGAGRFVDIEVIFVDLPDRVDVIFRYKQVGYDQGGFSAPIQWSTANYDTGYNFNPNIANPNPNTTGVPIAGIQKNNCIFEGSGSLDNQQALVAGSVSSEVPGDYVFYIKDGEIHGYNEVTLFENGSAPIRKSVVPYKDILRPQGCLVRVESKKKVGFYLTDKITGGEIDLTSPLPPLLSANTLIGDPAEPNPLLNKSKLIG